MAFSVTHDFTSNTKAQAAQVNTNFSDIETELNAFPTSGTLKDGAVSATAKISDGVITWAKLAATAAKDEDDMASNSATAVASQQSIKAYVDNQLDSHLGSGSFNPTTYAGAESMTFPNGRIEKTGSSTPAVGQVTVTFATAFPNACVAVFVIMSENTDQGGRYAPYIRTRTASAFNYYAPYASSYRWLAIGY